MKSKSSLKGRNVQANHLKNYTKEMLQGKRAFTKSQITQSLHAELEESTTPSTTATVRLFQANQDQTSEVLG